jgi:acetoacetyl-CoA reductase
MRFCPGYIGTDMVMAVQKKVREHYRADPRRPPRQAGGSALAPPVIVSAPDDAGFINGSTISANGAQFFV